MDIFKVIFLFVVPLILFTAAYGAYDFGQKTKTFQPLPPSNMTYQRYDIHKTSSWKDRFNHIGIGNDYNTIKRKIVGSRQNSLQIRRNHETYLIEFDSEVNDIVQQVKEVSEQTDKTEYNGRYFLVQYDRFVEIVYFDLTQSITPLSSQVKNGTYQAEICLELQIQATTNAKYHIDDHNNIWIVTVSMNKVVFIQIYSCILRRLIHEFRYILDNEEFVNEPVRIVKASSQCMNIEVLTYSLKVITVQVCPYSSTKSIRQFVSVITHTTSFSNIQTDQFQVFQGFSAETAYEQFNKILQHIINVVTFTNDSSLISNTTPSDNENLFQQFDSIAMDEDNHYLINLSENTTYSGIMSLNQYMIPAKAPLFHNNSQYHKFSILEILDKEDRKEFVPDVQHKYLVPGINITKRLFYKAAYRVYPDYKVEHLGLGGSLVFYHPSGKLEQKQFTFIRTKDGGVVSQGQQFKGTFDKLPSQYEEVYQIVDTKAPQLIPGIFQAHVGYINFMTRLSKTKTNQFNRIDLVNMIGGKTAISHYISIKEGYKYVSTMVLNSQWWILQYSSTKRQSKATKYELYANSSAPSQIINIKRVYGVLNSEEHLNREDDLSALMSQFVNKYNQGYILLSIYRCIDEYYYIQYTDQTGSHYGVARIHFKNLSNRRLKASNQYSGRFQKMMLLEESMMLPAQYSRQPYSVLLKDVNLFTHLPKFIQTSSRQQPWHKYCENSQKGLTFKQLEKVGGFYYFPMNYYAKGNYGCNYNSNKESNQEIMGLNMRNMIIHGKLRLQNKRQIRIPIINKIIYAFPIYILIVIVFAIILKVTNRGKVEVQPTKNLKEGEKVEGKSKKGKEGDRKEKKTN